ncbi:LacI family DNA-binding transcriptional regulator [Neoactinobaculum massilliense]|uniref:LacI family DNA-binding transcriptional regulator n=1 Tax=Neoactinobaculum massilliense TaxID=2364794 RepID=UPI000F524E9D|nr:LacI family DNA-binding transcriptional regulator [Neoactinobaculum massilliense]
MAKPTIRDIATQAGVSPAAVSFTLNNRPGVSQATRERILAVARQSGWTPNTRARSLSRARADAVGLVVTRPDDSYTSESFYFRFIVGLQNELSGAGIDVVLRHCSDPAAESDIYERWSSSGRVDGVIILDPVSEDPRFPLLRRLNLPAVVVGQEVEGFPSLITQDAALMEGIAAYLASTEVRRIGYVAGIASLTHTVQRHQALEAFSAQNPAVNMLFSADTDFTENAGRKATRTLVDAGVDALIFDNEVLALGGLTALSQSEAQRIQLFSCEDSPLCRVAQPQISAVESSAIALGRNAGALMLERLTTQQVPSRTMPVPQLIIRAVAPPVALPTRAAAAPPAARLPS